MRDMSEDIRQGELAEARAYTSLLRGASLAGFSVAELGGAVLLLSPAAPRTLVLNRVLGWGSLGEATEESLDAMLQIHRQLGQGFGIELAPSEATPRRVALLRRRGFRRVTGAQVLGRAIEPAAQPYHTWLKAASLRVESVGPESAAVVAGLCVEGFAVPPAVGRLIELGTTGSDWFRWLAFDGNEPVGVGLSHDCDGLGWLGWTYVRPSHRGLGVHAAIVARCLEAMATQGCRWVVTDTALVSPEHSNASHNTMCRLGFVDLYRRNTYVWAPPRPAGMGAASAGGSAPADAEPPRDPVPPEPVDATPYNMTPRIESSSRASFIQRSMWALSQRFRRAPINVMSPTWQVRGRLNVDALAQALRDLVGQHPTLRARLTMSRGQLWQEVMESAPVPLMQLDIDGATPQARIESAVAWLQAGALQIIDVVAGPPITARLARLGPEEHVLGLYVHHAMGDGWSCQIIIRDLAACYEARSQGRVPALATPSLQYADMAESQFRTYESGGFDKDIGFWRDELASPAPPFVLPATGPRKGNRDFLASSPAFCEPAETLAALREHARHSRVSTFAVLLAGLAVLLHQRTATEDLLIGVPTLNRWSREDMEFVGCATNLLPARIRPHKALPFDELCRQAHLTVRRVLAHGRVPLELVLRETQESLLGGPHMPVWCQLWDLPPPVPITAAGVAFHGLQLDRAGLLAELDVDMAASPQGLRCEFAYRPSLFDRSMVDAMMADYGSILRAVARRGDVRVAALCDQIAQGPG